jgi:hypothetical protein
MNVLDAIQYQEICNKYPHTEDHDLFGCENLHSHYCENLKSHINQRHLMQMNIPLLYVSITSTL